MFYDKQGLIINYNNSNSLRIEIIMISDESKDSIKYSANFLVKLYFF